MTPKPNRLAREKSPYLLQHSRNPVDWYPWGDAAFARARSEDRPVFLSSGYAACHWCHVMERESFSDPAVAEELNKRFVCVKVDREERPEVDGVYMAALHAMGRQGGWPMSMWLTPDRKPILGGAYLPPERLKETAAGVSELWKSRRGEVEASASALLERLAAASDSLAGGLAGPGVLDAAFERFGEAFDGEHGGFGGAPKFPQPTVLSFLLDYSRRTGDDQAKDMVVRTLRGMTAGGIHDHLGGGFARYATDAAWRVPHFEKMLYDNAQLLAVFAEAHRDTGAADLAETARRIAAYMLKDLKLPGGGFACGEDADSEGVEGRFYLWTKAEVEAVVDKEWAKVFCRLYGIGRERSILRRAMTHDAAASELELCAATVEWMDEECRGRLKAARAKRVRPFRDDKVLASWNGLAIGALARAGRILNEPAWIEAAEAAAEFVLAHLWRRGRLLRRWRDAESRFPGGLEDYAFLADGLLALHEATGRPAHLSMARRLAGAMVELFSDERGGFYATAKDDASVPVRLKTLGDGALPSGNAVAARGLIRLSTLSREPALLALAEGTAAAFGRVLEKTPEAMPCMLSVVDLLLV